MADDLQLEEPTPKERESAEQFRAKSLSNPDEGFEKIAKRVFGPEGFRGQRAKVRILCMNAYYAAKQI